MERVVHECHREPSIPISEHSVVFNCACDARTCVVLHISESLMMLCTLEMREIINNLPMKEDERMETFQLNVLSAAAFRNDRPIHLLKHMEMLAGSTATWAMKHAARNIVGAC